MAKITARIINAFVDARKGGNLASGRAQVTHIMEIEI
jgi:hypothetical protein